MNTPHRLDFPPWFAAHATGLLLSIIFLFALTSAFPTAFAQPPAPSSATVRAVFARAKAAEDRGSVNFYGFYVGMPKTDADTLVGHYALASGEFAFEGDPVYFIHLSLKSVRQITKGGNSFEELLQAVANRVGRMSFSTDDNYYRDGYYKYETIDGIRVTMSERFYVESALGHALDGRQFVAGFFQFDTTGTVRKESDRRRLQSSPEVARTATEILGAMVRIPGKPYKMGKTEVTQAQWETIMGYNPSFAKGAQLPVEQVSLLECRDFVKLLNSISVIKRSGLVFRLPERAELVHASFAGSSGPFCRLADGTDIVDETIGRVAWFASNSDQRTHPVGKKEPNAFGLYDVFGNVAEWTGTETAILESYATFGGSCRDEPSRFMHNVSGWNLENLTSRDRTLGIRLCADDPMAKLSSEFETWKENQVQKGRASLHVRSSEREHRDLLFRQIMRENSWSTNIVILLPGNESLVMVRTPNGLWVSETEVTESQWAAIMTTTGENTNVWETWTDAVRNVVWFYLSKDGVSPLQFKVAMRTNNDLRRIMSEVTSSIASNRHVENEQFVLADRRFEEVIHETAKVIKLMVPNWPADSETTPVSSVDLEEALRFVENLNSLESVASSGLHFRLPSDEEWEFACRAGSTGTVANIASGDGKTNEEGSLNELAWFSENSKGQLHPIAQKRPNAWGLYDMHGNVSEWTLTEATWEAQNGQSVVVVRGGSWLEGEVACQCPTRSGMQKGAKSPVVGFRIFADESEELHAICAASEKNRLEENVRNRLVREREEAARREREEQLRLAREREEAARREREEQLRLAREREEAARREREEAERIARERAEAARAAEAAAARAAWEESVRQRREEIAARTRDVELPGGVRLEMVKTPDGLWFGKTEVTRAQWNAVMNAPSDASSGGTKSRSGLQAPLLAKFAERGISDEQIAALMSANEETAEAFGQLRALFAQMESAGTASLFLDSDEFETLLHNTAVMFGAGSWNDADDGDDDDLGDASSSGSEASDFPVVNVSIVDCARFIKTLNALPAAKEAGLRFRLPTLSEWRKASLAGGKRPFGSTFMGDDATIRDVGWIHNDEAPGLHPVAQRQPNAWGLYDMFGNVREFVGPVPKEDDAYIRAYGGSFRTWEENLRQGDDFNDPFWYKSKADDLGLRLCAEESK